MLVFFESEKILKTKDVVEHIQRAVLEQHAARIDTYTVFTQFKNGKTNTISFNATTDIQLIKRRFHKLSKKKHDVLFIACSYHSIASSLTKGNDLSANNVAIFYDTKNSAINSTALIEAIRNNKIREFFNRNEIGGHIAYYTNQKPDRIQLYSSGIGFQLRTMPIYREIADSSLHITQMKFLNIGTHSFRYLQQRYIHFIEKNKVYKTGKQYSLDNKRTTVTRQKEPALKGLKWDKPEQKFKRPAHEGYIKPTNTHKTYKCEFCDSLEAFDFYHNESGECKSCSKCLISIINLNLEAVNGTASKIVKMLSKTNNTIEIEANTKETLLLPAITQTTQAKLRLELKEAN